MSDIIPVIVHHETGEKPQTGGKKNQEYLRYCIAQAKKYNEKVVLLGSTIRTGATTGTMPTISSQTNGRSSTVFSKTSPLIHRHGRKAFSGVSFSFWNILTAMDTTTA